MLNLNLKKNVEGSFKSIVVFMLIVFTVFCFLFVHIPLAFADETILDFYDDETTETSLTAAWLNDGCFQGQSFNATSSWNITKAAFLLRKQSSPTGNIFAGIWISDNDLTGVPTTDTPTYNSSSYVEMSSISSQAWYNFTFSNALLNASTCYIVGIYPATGASIDGGNYIFVSMNDEDLEHEGQSVRRLDGDWDNETNYDLTFYLYGEEVDATNPTYSGLSSSSTTANASCNFNVTVTDETDLSHWIFGTNNTGTWANETATAFSTNPESIGETKTLNATVGVKVGYQFYFNDTSDNWNSTTLTYITTTDGDVPTFSAITSNTTIANAGVELNVTISDNAAVSHFIYSWNNTGTWVNQTTTAFSSNPCQLSGTFNSTVGLVISVKAYANDTSDNWGTSSQYNFTLTGYNLTLQARDASGTNLPRTVTFTVTFPNSTETDFTSSTSGTKSITTCYGTHNVTVKWGDHLVKSSTSVSVTGDTTSNLDTKIQRLDYGTDYVLISLNNTDLVTPTLDGENNIHFHDVAASGEIEIKIDITNWKTTEQPSWFEAGTSSYGVGDGTWSFSDNVFTLTSDYDGVQDVFLVFVVEAGGGGAGGGGGGEPDIGPEEGGEVPEEEPSEEPTGPIITPPKDLGDLTPELAVFLIGAIVVGVALLAETKKGKGKFKVLKAKNRKFKKI